MVLSTDATAKVPKRRLSFAFSPIASYGLRMPLGFLRVPLIRNGYALIANAGITSVLGLIFWLVAARVHTVEDIGRGAALITTLLALGNVAQLGFGNVLNRFLPGAGVHAGRLVLTAYGVGAAAAAVFSSVFLLGVKSFFPALAFLVDDAWTAAWFVLSAVVWTLFLLEDGVLSGLRKSLWVPVTNTTYALVKIIILIPLAGTALAEFGPFAAWTFPVFVIVALVNIPIIRYLFKPPADGQASGEAVGIDKLTAFMGWDYAGTLAMMAGIGVAPLLIVTMVGPAANASYHLAWTIAYSLYLLGRSMSISLLAESAADRRRLPVLTSDALVHTMLMMGIGVVMVVILAPFIMGLFGPPYTPLGTPLLRLLALSCLPWGVTTIYLATARAQGHMSAVAAVQATTSLIAVGLGWFLLGQFGVLGMGMAWLAGHSLVAIGIGVVAIATGGMDKVTGWLLDLAASGARIVATVSPAFRKPRSDTGDEASVSAFIARTNEPGAGSWRPLGRSPSRGSVQIDFIGEPKGQALAGANFDAPEGTRAVLKRGLSPQGSASLVRQQRALALFRDDPRLADWGFRIPEQLAFNRTPDAVWSIERFIPGKDGRSVLQNRAWRAAARVAASDAIGCLHSRTAKPVTIDLSWIERWIERPAARLHEPVHTLMSREQRGLAIAAFRQHQRDYWLGRNECLGWYHGDFSPGNLLYRPDGQSSESGPKDAGRMSCYSTVEGIIDWDRAGEDGPAGFDICQLALTMRRLLSGRELGDIVRDLHLNAQWDEDELAWFDGCKTLHGPSGDWTREPEALRAMVGLVWLEQVTANMEKSGKYPVNRLWSATNVERVLQMFLPGGSKYRRLHPGRISAV